MEEQAIMASINQRSNFDLSHHRLQSGYMAKLMPCLILEVYPGDTHRIKSEALIRLSALVAPTYHEINAHIDYFYVPNRLIWDSPSGGFENFITGGVSSADSQTPPTLAFTAAGLGQCAVGDLADYMGVIPSVDCTVSALPFRAYSLIWNEWYRDQNLQTARVIDTTDGADTTTDVSIASRCWEKDYFTSALPYPQKFNNPVSLPLGTSAPLSGTLTTNVTRKAAAANPHGVFLVGSDTGAGDFDILSNASHHLYRNGGSSEEVTIDPNGNWEISKNLNTYTADLSSATAATINELREAIATQIFWERRARGGGRYVEYVQMEFGIRPYDQLRRPEYLGGVRSPIMINEVLQHSETGTTPIGTMAGHGITAMSPDNSVVKSFSEHGWIIAILSIMPRTLYGQGLHKSLLRDTRFSYLHPEFAGLGEQAIENRELYAAHSSPTGTFGYQGRYNELRYMPNSFHGSFRTSDLYNWHQGRIFSADPSLNDAFVTADPTTRIHAVTNKHTVLALINHSIQSTRCLSKYAVPSELGI